MKYLLATDGSPPARKAAAWIEQHLACGPADVLFLVYVFPLPEDDETYHGVLDLPRDPADERVRKVAETVFNRIREAVGEWSGTLHEIVLVGNPAHEVLEFAAGQNIDLIITGSSGRTPRTEMCLGSVSNALIHRALCPVLVVR